MKGVPGSSAAAQQEAVLAAVYTVGEFEVRPAERCVLAGGAPVVLGARAFDLLLALIERRDRVVGKDELLALVWPGVVVEENNLTVQVSALRKVLGAAAIATVPGRGYRFALDPGAAPALPAGERSIVVLPFDALSEDRSVCFLADGLVEDVIALLARVPGFFVISRRSSFEYRRRDHGPAEVARELGVRYVVEGSVRPVQDGLRVATHLVEAASGRVLWSGSVQGDRASTGDLQEAIARGILSELEPELTRAEIQRIHRRHPDNIDAWGRYYQALGALAQMGWTEQAIAEACDGFQATLALDPDFQLARANWAVVTALGVSTGLVAATEHTVHAARNAADRAIEAADGDSQVLGYAGCALCDLGETARGTEVLERSLALDPSNAQAHVALGAAQALNGDVEAGIARMRHGMRISPRDRRLGFWGAVLSGFLLRAGRPDEALAEARASQARDPRLYLSRAREALALLALNRDADAALALAAARRLRPGLTLAEAERMGGRRAAGALARLWTPDGTAAP